MPQTPTCPACGAASGWMPWAVLGEWRLARCTGCGLQWMDPQPDDEVLGSLYGKEYYKSWGLDQEEEPAFLRTMKRSTFRRQLRLLASAMPSGQVLDVGCATGLFMEAAREMGYAVSGLDVSAWAVEVARGKFGQTAVHLGQLESLLHQGVQYDAITMSDYLEHVRSPAQAMEMAGSLLKPGGCLLVQTPDVSSPSAGRMGRRWTHYKLEHLFYFTPAAVRELAARHGFEVLHIGRARKALNLAYVRHQFSTYPHPLFTPLVKVMHALSLPPVRRMNVTLPAGELIALMRRKA